MQAFEKLRVIDLTHVLAGPFCTYQLAVLGAQVIKIESPLEPDMMRADSDMFPAGAHGLSASFQAQSANKQAISIDLTTDKGKEVLRRLIKTADVLVENYRPGALQKLGFDYEAVTALKPDIIYCSLSGFGQQGPNSQRTAYDNVIQAYSGMMSATGDEKTAPIKIGPAVLDYGTGIQAAYAIAAALYQRSETGQGQHIDIAMLDAALMLMSADISHYQTYQELPELSGNQSSHSAGYGCYETKNGLLMLGAFTAKQTKKMWQVLGDAEYGEQFANCQPPAMKKTLQQDQQKIATLLKQKTATQWEEAFNDASVPAARVRKLDETLQEEQLNYRTILQSLENDTTKRKFPVASFRYAHDGPKIKTPPPALSQHTREIMLQLGYRDDDIEHLCHERVISIQQD